MQWEANCVVNRNYKTQHLLVMNSTKSLRRWSSAMFAAALCVVSFEAQGAGFELKAAAFTSGGGVATNASFHLAASCPGAVIGPASGGSFTLAGKFPGIRLVQTPGAPRLTLSASGSGYLLRWPAAFSGFRLQTTASLTEPHWVEVPLPVLVAGDENTVNVPVNGNVPMSFYRLIRP